MMTPDDRINSLVDHHLIVNDPMYAAQVSMFRRWVSATKWAMKDEGIDPEVIMKVLNRITYSTPDGSLAHIHLDAVEKLRLGRSYHP